MSNQMANLLLSALGGNRWGGGPTSRGLGQTRGVMENPNYGGGYSQEPQQFWGQASGRLGSGAGPPRGGGGMDIAGMRGNPGPQGPAVHGYYSMGAIPTAWNNEVIKPKYYHYSDTPDLAKMIRRPWDPGSWDPNFSYVPSSDSPGGARGVYGGLIERLSRRR